MTADDRNAGTGVLSRNDRITGMQGQEGSAGMIR